MKIIEDLENEHRLLEDAAGSLVTLCEKWTIGDSAERREDLKKLILFFRDFMVNFHTKKEEDLLCSELEKLNIPRGNGPMYFYELEHKQHLQRANEFLNFLENSELTNELKEKIKKSSIDYCSEIWEHIDKEDSVFFREARDRIKGKQKLDLLASYEPYLQNHPFDENLVRNAEEIIKKYPPVQTIPDVFRGDGCMSCRYYGEECRGIEHEWWTEHEWEDFFESNKGE